MNPTWRNWRAAQRLQAWHLKQQGWSQRQIAEALGVSEEAVSQWMAQRAHLPTLRQQGPEAYGFQGERWTRGRIVAVMRLTFGLSSHLAHIGRLGKALRWSLQKPARRAQQRDDAAMARWRDAIRPPSNKGRRSSPKGSSASMSWALIPCRVSCAPMPLWGTHRSCENGGPATTSPPSVRSRRQASGISTARTTP
jgi:transposase